MKIDGFPYVASVCGHDRSVIDDKGGYIPLAHGEQYFLKIENGDTRRASVNVKADGVLLGNWIIPINFDGSILIERPQDQAKLLTFFAKDSEEAAAALLGKVDPNNLGVLQFTFTRESAPPPPRPPMLMRAAGSHESFDMRSVTRGLGAGGTGLTGQSQQTFGTTQFNPEPGFEPVVISMRLVHDPERKIAMDVTPLSGHRPRVNDIPPPVGGDNPEP